MPRDEESDTHEDHEDTAGVLAPPTEMPPGSRPEGNRDRTRLAVRTLGELLVTFGVVVLLFVAYELYVTNWTSGQLQNEADAELEEQWSHDRELHADPAAEEAFARLYIPSFGADWSFTVQEGVTEGALEVGPGHYPSTAFPGEPGNTALAGHRVGKGAPFNDVDLLDSCDPLVVETGDTFFVYRVLPMPEEVADWSTGKGQDPQCSNVTPMQEFDDAYESTVGRVIVAPDRSDAIAPVPYREPGEQPEDLQAPLLSLTTCHPQFSDRERMIIHGVLTERYEKQPGVDYEDLLAELEEV